MNPNGKKSFSGFFALCFFLCFEPQMDFRWLSRHVTVTKSFKAKRKVSERFCCSLGQIKCGEGRPYKTFRQRFNHPTWWHVAMCYHVLPCVAMCCQHVGQWDDSQEFSGHLCITIDGFWLLISIFVHEKQNGYMWFNYSAKNGMSYKQTIQSGKGTIWTGQIEVFAAQCWRAWWRGTGLGIGTPFKTPFQSFSSMFFLFLPGKHT